MHISCLPASGKTTQISDERIGAGKLFEMKPSVRMAVQMVNYLGASVAGTLVHYSLLIILIRSLTLNPLWASTSGAIAGALVIYVLNYFVTFRSIKGHLSASSRFFLVAAICTVVNGWMLNIALTQMNWSLAPAQVFATGAQFSIGFAIHRVWTF